MIDTEIPSIGIALYGNEISVLRSDGSSAEPGEVGEICIRGHNVLLEYVNPKVGRADSLQDEWFHSQDFGYEVHDPESGHIFFVITGRKKNVAKIMGMTISLEEMEHALQALPHISDVACFTIPDQLLGEAIIAAVVSDQDLDTEHMQAHLRHHFFNPLTLPKRYVCVDMIPRTATGKIIRTQLANMLNQASVANNYS